MSEDQDLKVTLDMGPIGVNVDNVRVENNTLKCDVHWRTRHPIKDLLMMAKSCLEEAKLRLDAEMSTGERPSAGYIALCGAIERLEEIE